MTETESQGRFGKFALLEAIQTGTAGTVHRARDTEHGRDVLLKVFSPTVSQNSAFERYLHGKWGDQQSLVEHPNVLRVYEVGREGDSCYVALEWAAGQRLSEVMAGGPLDAEQVLDILHQAAEGLRAVHRREVLHGALTPSDVLVTQDRLGRRLVKVCLFDLSTAGADGVVSVFGELLGVPKYMAPEVVQGRAPGAQADIFALGVIAYEMAAGREPFHAERPVGYLFANCQAEPIPADQANQAVPRELSLVIARMLAQDPAERYRSIERLLDDLDRCSESMRTHRVELVPYGTDSAFAREYQLAEPKLAAPGHVTLKTGHVVGLIVLVALAVGLAGYSLGTRGGPVATPPRPHPAQPKPQPAEIPVTEPTAPQAPVPAAPAPAVSEEEQAKRAFDRAAADSGRYSAAGSFDLAVAAFDEVARRYGRTSHGADARSEMARIYIDWGDALAHANDPAGALDKYRKALEGAGGESKFAQLAQGRLPAAMAAVADDARKRGEYAEALRVYGQISEQFPNTMEAQLLERRKPELLLSQTAVMRQQGQLEAARDTLLQITKDYAGTDWAERAAAALPDVYLLIAQRDVQAGEPTEARQQVRTIAEAYPDQDAGRRAAAMDAQLLLRLFLGARQSRDKAAADKHYAELMRLYPGSPSAVEAARARLGLEAPASPLAQSAAESEVRHGQDLYARNDLAGAISALRDVLRDARSDSPSAAQAVLLLPQWTYESALRSFGSDSVDQCRLVLQRLTDEFAGTEAARSGAAMLDRLDHSPEGMVYVPAGPFQMGTNLSEIAALVREHNMPIMGGGDDEIEMLASAYGFGAEVPRHIATTGAFFIGRTEVTNAEYKAFVDATKHTPPSGWVNGSYLQGAGKLPVVRVALADAQAYAEWRGGRLPTETEWEKAARGVDGRIYPWGKTFDASNARHMLPEAAGPLAVGSFPAWASPYGCLDMIGNVMEWTTSPFQPYPGNKLAGAAEEGQFVVERGGSWRQEELVPMATRCASRYQAHPGEADAFTGFRIVIPIPEQSGAAAPATPAAGAH